MKTILVAIVFIRAGIAQDEDVVIDYNSSNYDDAEQFEVDDNDYNEMITGHTARSTQISQLFEDLISANRAENPDLMRANSTRSIIDNPFFNLANLEQYGCWCRFERDTHGTGRGLPVDPYDNICEIYHHGVTCLAMDHGKNCNPWEIQYEYLIPSYKEVDCVSLNNGNQCKIDLCIVEAHLVLDTLKLITDWYAPKLDHIRFNPDHPDYTGQYFTHEDDCRSKTGHGPGGHVWKCCGQYHRRWPFRTTNDINVSKKECCDYDDGTYGLKTYDPTISDCCDGTVHSIGSGSC